MGICYSTPSPSYRFGLVGFSPDSLYSQVKRVIGQNFLATFLPGTRYTYRHSKPAGAMKPYCTRLGVMSPKLCSEGAPPVVRLFFHERWSRQHESKKDKRMERQRQR